MTLLSNDELHQVTKQLDQAIYNHEQWCKNLYRTLICRLMPDERDLQSDAHHHCAFGQWYYEHSPAGLKTFDGFTAIESVHHRLHHLTTEMLSTSANGGDIPPEKYDQFSNSLDGLRLELMSLKREVQELLFNRDPLTSAFTRLGMLSRLREQHALLERKQQPCALIMLDLDHFKRVNDTWGHTAGDAVLAAVAQNARGQLRPYDLLFRFGGEEFLICLPDTNIEAACAMAERLRKSIEEMAVSFEDNMLSVTVSLGIAPLAVDTIVEDSIANADHALYAAKEAGRNRSITWTEGLKKTNNKH